MSLGLAYLAAFSAAFFSSAKDIGSKLLALNISGAASSVGSFVYALPFFLILLALLHGLGYPVFQISSGFWSLIILRALSDAVGESCKMYAFKHGEFSTVSIILSLLPIFVVGLSVLITNDPVTPALLIGALLVVAASLTVIYKNPQTLKGSCFALGAVTVMATNTCLDRLAVQTAHPVFSGFAMTALAGLFTAPLFLFDGSPRELLSERKVLGTRGLFEVLFMAAKLSALTVLPATVVMICMRSALIINVTTGLIYFREGEAKRKIIALLLALAGIIIALI